MAFPVSNHVHDRARHFGIWISRYACVEILHNFTYSNMTQKTWRTKPKPQPGAFGPSNSTVSKQKNKGLQKIPVDCWYFQKLCFEVQICLSFCYPSRKYLSAACYIFSDGVWCGAPRNIPFRGNRTGILCMKTKLSWFNDCTIKLCDQNISKRQMSKYSCSYPFFITSPFLFLKTEN